jgi:hypothetical protein
MNSEEVVVTTLDGRPMRAYVAWPAGARALRPAVVLGELFGLNDVQRAAADRVGAMGGARDPLTPGATSQTVSSAAITSAIAAPPASRWRNSERRNRGSVDLVATTIHPAGTSCSIGALRRARATISCSSRLSMTPMSATRMARGYGRPRRRGNRRPPRCGSVTWIDHEKQ